MTQVAQLGIGSPEHLKAWLVETGRTYMTLHTPDLVDALPWPDGVQALIDIIDAYRVHRSQIPTGHTVIHEGREVMQMKTEGLTDQELSAALTTLWEEAKTRGVKMG